MYAEKDFQLLEARTGEVRVEIPWRRKSGYLNPHVVLSVEHLERPAFAENITAIIGKNGTGKSHLLTSIVQTFVALEDVQMSRREKVGTLPLEYLSYRVDGRLCTVERLRRRKLVIRVDGREVDVLDLPLPQRVVALTVTPFDKFPVPLPARYPAVPARFSLYEYLGLRDRFNRASLENLLYRSLNNLFDEGHDDALRRVNIGAVFEYLQLRPALTVVYQLRVPKVIRDAIADQKTLNYPEIGEDYSQRRRVEQLLAGGLDVNYLQDLLETAMSRADSGQIRTTADFSQGGEIDDTFRYLQPLRRAGFLRIKGIEVTQSNGLVSDLKRASSGQLSMIVSLLSLASVITNASLVLIDEPELSLHPEWQSEYVDLLVKTFSRFQGCHFILATHSPMVISELPEHAKVIALDRSEIPTTEETAGQSADFLLAELFGSPSPGNLYVRQRIVDALRLAGSGEANSQAFKDVLSDLQQLADELDSGDPARELIANLESIALDSGKEAAK